MPVNQKRSDCPISCALDIWGDKWSLLIIRDIIFSNKSSYGDFLKSPEGIATNILASRLQSLEEGGLIEKSSHPDNKVKVIYKLTQKGIDLMPVFIEIYIWAEKYFEIPKDIKTKLKKVKKDKEVFVKLMSKNLQTNRV
ncbi:winged helix-turn-helix transcriptional regulator [Leptospira vanthielii]|uniref:Transcriptional regulator n=2 Tax=Leptospira vanthielii TaxID=293085 RepID=A0ABY2NUC2_9LEPT|nr:helix-turn-helix domain-containing protein [Leptospira vanthielii]EMY68569.1 transcriptional regulator, HxlR family [Leptospira vanthielii serovar Holland str. Waz Holland = ATCC 700522]TGM61469.1 transcriptional regulator [Leptospira vanthielii]